MKSNSRFTWVIPISVSWIMLLFVFAPALASKADGNVNGLLIKHEQVVVADNHQHQLPFEGSAVYQHEAMVKDKSKSRFPVEQCIYSQNASISQPSKDKLNMHLGDLRIFGRVTSGGNQTYAF